MPLGIDNNVATFHLAYGYSKYNEFCMEARIENDEVMIGNEAPMSKVEALKDIQKRVWSKDIRTKFLNGPSKLDSKDE